MDRRAWQATAHAVTKSWILLSTSIMSFLSLDSIWRGGGSVKLVCSPPYQAFSVWREVWLELTLVCGYCCST